MAAMNKHNRQKLEREPVPPDGGYGWIILMACFVISFIVDGVMYSFGVILPKIKSHFDVSQEQANLLASLNTGFLFLSGPIVSALSSQFGIRTVVMGGATVTALVYFSSAFAPSITFIAIMYGVIGGISTGCTYIASLIIVAQYFKKLKGITTGITMSGSGFGSFAFAPFTGFLLNIGDWKYTLIIMACILLQCCLMGSLLRPVPTRIKAVEMQDKRNKSDNINNQNNEQNLGIETFTGSMVSIKNIQTDDEDESDKPWYKKCGGIILNILKEMTDLKLLKENLAFSLIVLSNFFVFFGYFIPFIYLAIRALELNITEFTWLFSIIGIVNIPARLLFGILADKRYLSPINLNTLSLLIATLSLWSFGFLNTFWTQAGFATAFAIGIAGTNCLCTPYLTDIVGDAKFSNAMGIINLFRGLGCFFGPFVGGFISEKTNSSLSAFYFSALCFSIGLVFSLMISFGGKLNLFKKENNATQQNSAELENLNKA